MRALSLELLRNGSCDTFPELMAEVTRRAKLSSKNSQLETNKDKGGDKDKSEKGDKDKSSAKINGTSTPTGSGGASGNNAIAVSKEWSGGPDGLPDVRIPESTVQAGVEFLKERIKDVVVPVDDDSD